MNPWLETLEVAFLAVLAVTDDKVIIGDPLKGLTTLSYTQFQAEWRNLGVVLRRPQRFPASE